MRQLNHLLRSLTLLVLAPSLFAGMLLTGCAVKTTSAPEVSLTFMNRPAIHLNVGKIQVVNRYQMPLKPPLVEHLMPVAPGAGVERWAMDILRAGGSGNTAVLTIHDASVTEISLQQKPGLKALLTLDQAQRYDARLRATLEIRDVNGQQRGQVEVEVTRSQTVPENITLNQRTAVWFQMVEGLLADFAAQMELQVRKDLGTFLR
ncbi:MAG: hypothetical protein CMH67_01045 [Nisaea sp.]|jgi:hypothetical protein|nr:hypothetical protein [Nisaea sp.]OUY00023.1 MAG: hypothetical protein CBB86_01165 [Candidatus Endolissoclinum sp. TMED26]